LQCNKKILVNAAILDDKPTGVGVYTYYVLEYLANSGFCYDIFTSYDNYGKIIPSKIIKTSKYTRPYPYKKLAGLVRIFINQTQLTLMGKKYDIIYSPTSHGSFFLDNQIITIHDLIALHFPEQYKMQYYYFKYFMPYLLKKARKIIAISQSTKNDLLNFYGLDNDRVQVIYNGFSASNFEHKENAKEYISNKYNISNFILTVGSSYPHKNIARLIEAYIHLPKEITQNYKLVITGYPNSYQQSLLKKYSNYNKKIIFIGYVDSKDLPYLYSAAELFVYPSLYEGFGFPPLEAMSCRCPVVVSNLSSLPEVCGSAAEYINPYDINSIAMGIQKVFYDQNYQKILVDKGLKQIQKFDWVNTIDQIEKLILDTVNDRD